MKRKSLLFVLVMCIFAAIFALAACSSSGEASGGSSGSATANGTYYRYKNDKYDKNDYIKIDGGKWTGDTGDSGKISISGSEFVMYADMYGEQTIIAKGTISGGVITVINKTSAGTEKLYYCQDGKTPPKDSGTGGGNSGGPSGTPAKNKVTVTYNANGGVFAGNSGTYTQSVEVGTTLTAPTAPTRTNYAFAGWAKSKGGTDMWAFATDEVKEAVTLYATWTEESAKIFSVDGASIDGDSVFMLVGNSTDSVSMSNKIVCSSDSTWKLYYDKLGQTEIPTKIAAQFDGALDKGDNVFYVVVTSRDGTQVNVYTLTIHRSYLVAVRYYDGDKLLDTFEAFTGYEYKANYRPYINGYTFNGWKNLGGYAFTSEVIYGPLSLYANKTANTYNVTLDVNGGNTLSNTQKTITYDSSFSLAVPTRTGYTFTGWYTSGKDVVTGASGSGISVWNIASNTTLKAGWEANTYTLTAQSNNTSAGSVTGGGEYKYDSSVTLTANTNNGYTFVGWYNGSTKLTDELSYTFTMGMTATYTAKWIRVALQSNNTSYGTVSYLSSKYKPGDSATATATTKDGCTFVGWYNGETKLTDELSYAFTMPAVDICIRRPKRRKLL